MVQLFLSEVDASGMIDSESAKLLVVLLNRLETTIWSAVVSSGCRSEARLWLCNSVSQLKSLSPRNQADLFVTVVGSKPPKWRLASQILQMIFEKRPYIAGPLIAKRSHILQRFFRGHPRRISEWFSSFDSSGGSDHKRGAKALSRFAFLNRDVCWEELEWKGKHGQSPAVVATKPHYFLDLDIQRTMDNFLEYVPEFWSSNEFAESLKDGEIFSIDRQYFLDMFVDLMMFKDDGSRDIWEVIDLFLTREPFSCLCQRLLIGLEESDFCVFLKLLSKYLRPEKDGDSNLWLEIVLSQYGDFDQLLVMNAVINQGRHLLRLMHDDGECKEEKEKISDIVRQISKANTFLTLLKECRLSMKATVETVRLLGLKSWVVHYRLSEECHNSLDSWENLFISSGITFRKSGKYSMLQSELQEESGNKLESIGFKSNKRKEKKKWKRRRRNFDYEEDNSDEFDILNEDQEGLQCTTVGSWLLSTDGFASSWTNADLPEHLSKHCFSVWMKWVLR